jgi:hypothetical protein
MGASTFNLATGMGGLNAGFALQNALSAYSDEAYTSARKLTGTGIVGTNPMIDVGTETYVGQIRWTKPINPHINVASLSTATDGTTTTFSSDYLNYIKTVRTHGASKVNMAQVVSQQDGLAKIGRDFAETRAQDEHNALLSVLRGVALSEALNGACAAAGGTGTGGQTYTNDDKDAKFGFYVDMGSAKPVEAASASLQGAARAEGFLQAIGKAWKDYEPDYAYLVTTPSMLASLRSANLVDQDSVSEGNINFSTIFGGKFRIIQSRASMSFDTTALTKINTGAGLDITVTNTTTSYIVLPGALAMSALAVPDPVEIQRNAAAYLGGGTTQIWYRWGYVLAPAGYDWAGSQTAFPDDAAYQYAVEGGTPKTLASVASGTMASTTGTWIRKATSALSLGILPVFHS